MPARAGHCQAWSRSLQPRTMTNVFRLVGGIFALVGAAMLAISLFLLAQRNEASRDDLRTAGVVHALAPGRDQDGGVTYTAIVRFADRQGQMHEFPDGIASRPPRFSRGERVPVLYDPQTPERAVIDDLWGRLGALLIIGPLGLLFAILGATLLIVDLRAGRRKARLLRGGQPIQARFLHVFRDTRIARNGDHPYRVVAQGQDPRTGALRRFESEPVWVDPTDRLQGRTITVLADPRDPDTHHMDLSPFVDRAALG